LAAVGVLGDDAGGEHIRDDCHKHQIDTRHTTYDAFKLISDVQKYGARVALFGRKINLSEHPLTFIEMLRRIVDHQITAEEAVKAYHDALKKLGIKPLREFADDKELTGTMTRYR